MGLLQLQQGFTIINNFKLYSLLIEKLFCDSDSNESSLTLKHQRIYHIYLMNLIPSPPMSIIPQKM